MRITYDRLGRPEVPGWVEVRGVGRILVLDEQLEEALEYDGQVAWELVRMTPDTEEITGWEFGPIPHYALGDAIPLPESPPPDVVPASKTPPIHYPHKTDEFALWLKEFLANLPSADRLLNLPEEEVEAVVESGNFFIELYQTSDDEQKIEEAKEAALKDLRRLLRTIDHHPEYSETIAFSLGLMGRRKVSLE